MIDKLLLTVLLVSSAVPASAAEMYKMFDKGQSQYTLLGGTAQAFYNSYLVFSGSASYYVANGLGVGFSLEKWLSDGPGITRYAPFVQYVFYRKFMVPLYVGGYYRHSVIDNLPSINSIGVRAGVLMATGEESFLDLGFVYESYLNCQTSIYFVCSEAYPVVSFTVGF